MNAAGIVVEDRSHPSSALPSDCIRDPASAHDNNSSLMSYYQLELRIGAFGRHFRSPYRHFERIDGPLCQGIVPR